MINNGIEIAELQIQLGGGVAWEWPGGNRGWNLPRVRKFFEGLQERGQLNVAKVDGCAYGLRDRDGQISSQAMVNSHNIKHFGNSFGKTLPWWTLA